MMTYCNEERLKFEMLIIELKNKTPALRRKMKYFTNFMFFALTSTFIGTGVAIFMDRV